MAQCEDKVYWIWLSLVFAPGSHRINALCGQFSGAREIYEMGPQERADSRAFTEPELERLGAVKLSRAEAIFLRAKKLGCQILTPADAAYPARLRHIYAMPAVLYVRGDISQIDQELVIAMVGTRSCSDYGLRAAERLGGELAENGAAVISGLAAGIDTAAIQGALRAGGKAYGVIGCGMDVIYPSQNKKLIEWMCTHTAVITEYPPATPPYPGNFPIRNRLISGLSLGTVVVEAAERSGALITANHALEQGKDVFGVSARIEDSRSAGVFSLIRSGAKPVFGVSDILEEYQHLLPQNPESRPVKEQKGQPEPRENEEIPQKTAIARPLPEGLDETGKKIIEAMDGEPVGIQTLAVRTGLRVGELLPALTELEIEGIVSSGPMGQFQLAKEYLGE